jgi:hypothetical protein
MATLTTPIAALAGLAALALAARAARRLLRRIDDDLRAARVTLPPVI